MTINKVLNINMVAKPVINEPRDESEDLDDDESFEVNRIKTAIDLEVLTEDEGAIRLEEIRRVEKDKEKNEEDEDKWNLDKSLGDINMMGPDGNPMPGPPGLYDQALATFVVAQVQAQVLAQTQVIRDEVVTIGFNAESNLQALGR